MDGLTDNEPLLYRIVILADAVDHLINDRPWHLISICILLATFLVWGSWVDLVAALGFLRWRDGTLPCSWMIQSKWVVSGMFTVSVFMLKPLRRFFLKGAGSRNDSADLDIVQCRTTFRGSLPFEHVFSSSNFMISVPIGFKRNGHDWIPSDNVKGGNNTWSHIDPSDHLETETEGYGLRAKLDDYLTSQNASPSDYPYAYLITPTSFLGHRSSSISFWYLYSREKFLSAIIFEINDIFGERRLYLTTRKPSLGSTLPDGQSSSPSMVYGCQLDSDGGSISIEAVDPFIAAFGHLSGIDITVNWMSSEGVSKLIAYVSSQGQSVNPTDMSIVRRVLLFAKWFWLGVTGFSRVVKEFIVLLCYQHLSWTQRLWARAESAERMASYTEARLEKAFRRYVQHLVQHARRPLALKYVPCGIGPLSAQYFTTVGDAVKNEVEIKVVNPAFYTRFVHYAHDSEAIFCELAENQTVKVDRPEILPDLLLQKGSPPLHATQIIDFIYFKSIQVLRSRPERLQTHLAPNYGRYPGEAADIRNFRISPMDAFMVESGDSEMKKSYRSTVLQLFLAERFLLGSVEVLATSKVVCRVCRCWIIQYVASSLLREIRQPTASP